jgi:hypothetical protein
MPSRLRTAAPIALLVLLGVLAGPASAAPRAVQRDHSDNGFSLNYDAARHRIVDAASSVFLRRDDRVRFLTGVRQVKVAGTRKLVGTITLTLQGGSKRLYEGDFKLKLTEAGGTVVTKTVHRRVLLRPAAGQRTAALRFPLRLHTGSYEVTGRFTRSAD